MKTTLQIIPNGPIETFSDAPMRVNGVRIQPTWAWSNAYRKIVRAELAKVPANHHEMARKYKAWLMSRTHAPD